MKKDFKYWLRWIVVFPGALLTGIFSTFPLHWILYSTLRNNLIFIDPYPELPERLLSPFVTALTFVWVGFNIAPEHKFKTAIILFGIYIVLASGTAFLTLSGTNLIGYKLYLQSGGVGLIMGIAGATIGLFIAQKHALRQ